MSSRAGNNRRAPKAKENDNVDDADARHGLPSGGSSSLSSPGGSASSASSSGGAAPTPSSGGRSGVEEAFHPPQHAYPYPPYPLHPQYRHHPSMPLPPPTQAPPSGGRRATSAAAAAAAASATVPGSADSGASAPPPHARHHYQQPQPTPQSRPRPKAIVIPPSAPRGGVQGALADLNAVGVAGGSGAAALYHEQQQSRSRTESKDQKSQPGANRPDSGAARGSSSKEAAAARTPSSLSSDQRQRHPPHPPPDRSHPAASEVATNRSSSSSGNTSSADEHSYTGEADRSGKATPQQEQGRGSAAVRGGPPQRQEHQHPQHGMYPGGYSYPYHPYPHYMSPAMMPSPHHSTPHNYPTANSLTTEGGPSSMFSPTPLGSINAEIEGEAPAKKQQQDKDMQDLFSTLGAPSFDESSPVPPPSGSSPRRSVSRSQPRTSPKQQGRRHSAQPQEQQKPKSDSRPSGASATQGRRSTDASSRKSPSRQPTDSAKDTQASDHPPRHYPAGPPGAGAVPLPGGPFSPFDYGAAYAQSVMAYHQHMMHQNQQGSTRTTNISSSPSKKPAQKKKAGGGSPSGASKAAAAAFHPGNPFMSMGQQQPHPMGAAHHMYGFGQAPPASSKGSDGKQQQQAPPAHNYANPMAMWGTWPPPPGQVPYVFGGQPPPQRDEKETLDDDGRSGSGDDVEDDVDRPANKSRGASSAKAKPLAAPPKKRADVSVAFEDDAGTESPPEQKKQRVKYGNPRSMSSNSLAHMASPTKSSSPDKRGSKRSAALQLQSPHIPQTPSGVGYFNTFGTPAGQDHSMGRDLFASNSFGGFSINDGEVGSPSQHWDTGLEDWRPEISGGQRRYGGDIASPFPTADMFNMSPIGSGGASTLLGSPVVDNSMGIYRPTHVASPSGRIPRPDLAPVPMLSGSSAKKGKSKAKTQSKRKKAKSPTRRSAPTPRSLHRSSSSESSPRQSGSSAAFPPHSSVNPLASPVDDPMRYFVQLGGAGSTIGDVRRGMNDINAAMERARAMMPLPPPPMPPPPPPSSFTGTPQVYYPSSEGHGDVTSYSGHPGAPLRAGEGARSTSSDVPRAEPEYRTPARSSRSSSGSRSKSRPRSGAAVNVAEFDPPRARPETHRPSTVPQTASTKAVGVTPSHAVPGSSGKKQRASSKTPSAKASTKTPSKKTPARSTRETPRSKTPQSKTPQSSRKSRPMPTPSPDSRGSGRGSIKGCNCKKSKCLKKYCECFAQQAYCSEGCRCQACCNTVEHEDARTKAIEEMKRKDSDAFETKNKTCNCKKSMCLKKYCDCFQAGVMCGADCKCKNCENYMGSQKLIDRRTKIKDTKGAELAMTASDEIWRGEQPPAQVTPAAAAPSSSKPPRRRGSPASSYSSSPASMLEDPSALTSMHSHFDAGSASLVAGQPRHPAEIGYSPASMRTPMHGPQVEAAKRAAASAARSSSASRKRQSATSRAASAGSVRGGPSQSRSSRSSRVVTASHPGRGSRKLSRTPRSPVQAKTRVEFDFILSKRRTGIRPGQEEPTRNYFGDNCPAVSKTSALTIFSYFSNEDTYNASLVSKQWNEVAFDDELWQLE